MKRSDIKNRRRTTLTLESDVNIFIEEQLKTSKVREKDLVNNLLRRGIKAFKVENSSPVSFTLKPHKGKLLLSDEELKEEINKII
mgnify:CR=1 FL=1